MGLAVRHLGSGSFASVWELSLRRWDMLTSTSVQLQYLAIFIHFRRFLPLNFLGVLRRMLKAGDSCPTTEVYFQRMAFLSNRHV